MRNQISFLLLSAAFCGLQTTEGQAQPLPFDAQISTYRPDEGEIMAFAVRLEQPFLAEQFEKSNKLRLEPTDENAYLIYPKETKFVQKHAEFYGRLKGTRTAKLKLSYEVVSEDLAGQPKVDVRTTEIEVVIPSEPGGVAEIHKEWARRQNAHFADLLRYYPDTSFFEYVLLQSQERYGVRPPAIPTASRYRRDQIETGLYHTFSGGLGLQQALQWEALHGRHQVGDLSIHIDRLNPPRVKSLDYQSLLEKKKDAGVEPQVHELAEFVPADQYFLHFGSMEAANQLIDLSAEWGESLLQLFSVTAKDPHLREKYSDQLCLDRRALLELFENEVISDVAVTGSDFFFAEGTDLTAILRLKDVAAFQNAAKGWLAEIQQKYPGVQQREVNYRGHQIFARYTQDRMVSSFVTYKDDLVIVSNSPVVMRKVIDVILKESPSLQQAVDYQYSTTLLSPTDDSQSVYAYFSEDFLKYLISPAFKVAQKRRLQAFNNLVMLNNASMFYRLEFGQSPNSLGDLVEQAFYDPKEVVDQTGSSYAWDSERDTATSSVFNRIKYLTPIVELKVLQVSQQEQQEYGRYSKRYESIWRDYFDPIAIRADLTDLTVKFETLVLPFANSNLFEQVRSVLAEQPQPLQSSRFAKSTILSTQIVPGRERIGTYLSSLPGVAAVLESDPTLTDLSWLGDSISIQYLDGSSILEVDPTRLQRLDQFFPLSVPQQSAISAILAATSLPVYFTIDVEDEDKAARLLDRLGSEIVVKGDPLVGLPTSFDAYRLPEYKGHEIFVLSYQLYAIKVRLHLTLANGQLLAATKLAALHEAVDAATEPANKNPETGQAQLHLNFSAMTRTKEELQLYWNEKLRHAAHRNVMPIYNLLQLYDVSIEEVNPLADAKYGVTYFCPGGGEYRFDSDSDQVYSTIYGNRQTARQPLSIQQNTPFSEFYNSLNSMSVRFEFSDESLIGTVEIERDLGK